MKFLRKQVPENRVITFSNNDIFDTSLIEVVGGVASLKLGGGPPLYPITNPTIRTAAAFAFKDIVGFREEATKPAGTEIKYIFQDGVTLKYWDGSNVVESDGTYSQSNTAIEILANEHLFIFNETVPIIVFLHSDDGTQTPSI